jgi:hypothetical protein
MTDGPIDLDGRRTAADKLKSVLRRRPANADSSSDEREKNGTDEGSHAGPARPAVEALETAIFLLELYAATAEAQDVRIQKLIKRTLADLAHLKKSEENDL